MIHLNGEEYRRAFHSTPAFPHNALLPSPDPDAAPGTMRSYRFNDPPCPRCGETKAPKDVHLNCPANIVDLPGEVPGEKAFHAEYLDGSTWKPVHSEETLRALAELPLDDRNGSPDGTAAGHLLEVKAIAPTAP